MGCSLAAIFQETSMKPRPAPPGTPVLLAATVLVLLVPGLAGAADRPPVAPVENVPETHWGVVVDDPYRYMEDLKDERVLSWIKGQGDHATGVLDGLAHRDEFLRRIVELVGGREWRVT
jgi:prolyl oligopeptidase